MYEQEASVTQKQEINIRVIRSGRRSLAMEVRPGAEVIVRAPYHATMSEIRDFVSKNRGWIDHHLELAKEEQRRIKESPYGTISWEQVQKYADLALKTIPPRVSQYAQRMGVTYHRITIRCQRTRWGSCSSKKNLNFNCLLMLTPPKVQDYVIVHELSHLKEMNHSPRFWAEVEKVLPDYRERRAWLKDHGQEIIGAVEAWSNP